MLGMIGVYHQTTKGQHWSAPAQPGCSWVLRKAALILTFCHSYGSNPRPAYPSCRGFARGRSHREHMISAFRCIKKSPLHTVFFCACASRMQHDILEGGHDMSRPSSVRFLIFAGAIYALGGVAATAASQTTT